MWATIHITGHLVLATIFISAAIAKIRSFSEFVEYLRVPFRKLSQNIAIIVLGLEISLAIGLALFLVPSIILTGMEIFLCGASLFIGLRLVYSNETSCKCWGGNQASLSHQESAILQLYTTPQDLWISTFRPALYGYRNGLLFLGGWILLLLEKASNTAILFTTGEMLTTLIICPICIAIGLISSIILKAYYIKQEEHPLKNALSPYLAPLVALSWYMNPGNNTNHWNHVSSKKKYSQTTRSKE